MVHAPETRRLFVIWTALFVSAATCREAMAADQHDPLISIQRGTIPVVLSAPHGGTIAVPGGKPKEEGTTLRDQHTAEIAALTAQFLTERLDGKPYYAIAQFSRRYIDPNRGPGFRESQAYSCPVSKVHYDAYHRALRASVDEVRGKFGRGLLIDIHGQSRRPGEIIRGTVQGTTVTAMLEAHGLDALIGPKSMFGQLRSRGYTVEPPVEDAPESPEDEVHFIGGYIVRAYGSHNPDGIDAIQVELGRDVRREAVRRQTASDLAEAIAVYVEHHVLPRESPSATPEAVGAAVDD